MTNKTLLALLVASASTTALSEPKNNHIRVGTFTSDSTLVSGGINFDEEYDGTAIDLLHYLNSGASFYIGGGTGDQKRKSNTNGSEWNYSSTEVFVGYSLSRVDLAEGSGSEPTFEVSRDDDGDTTMSATYLHGLGNGLTGSVGYATDLSVDGVKDYDSLSIGLYKSLTDTVTAQIRYFDSEYKYDNGASRDSDGFSFAAIYSF